MSWHARHAAISASLDQLTATGKIVIWSRESTIAGPWWKVSTAASPLAHGFTTTEVEALIAELTEQTATFEQLALV